MIRILAVLPVALFVGTLLFTSCSDDATTDPVITDPPPTMTGTWEMDLGAGLDYYLDLVQNDSLLTGNYRDGVDTLWIEGIVNDQTRAVNCRVLGRIYNFPEGKAGLFLEGVVHPDRRRFTGIQVFRLESTGEMLLSTLFVATWLE